MLFHPYKWPYKKVNGVISPLNQRSEINLLISGDGAHLACIRHVFFGALNVTSTQEAKLELTSCRTTSCRKSPNDNWKLEMLQKSGEKTTVWMSKNPANNGISTTKLNW